MDYYVLEETLQVLFEATIPLSHRQNERIREMCVGVLLAGSSQLSRIAPWLKHPTQQDSRIQWLRRSLEASYLQQEYVYGPFVRQSLAQCHSQPMHILMDRTRLADPSCDLLSLSLNFRHRAVPIGWQFMAHGSSSYETQKALIERCRPLLPAHTPIVFHGDSEFGSVPMMQYLQQIGWQFVLGQACKNYYRQSPCGTWYPLSSLPVTPGQAVYLSKVELTKTHAYGPLNVFAFYQPHFNCRHHKGDITYCVTSLPITPALRRIGHRRWGIECCFRDFKSSGWNVQLSDLSHEKRREGLFTVLSLAYLWSTCLGRWLCKSGQRHFIDAKRQRHLSLFRIGWDWLVYRYNSDLTCPTLLTLYQ